MTPAGEVLHAGRYGSLAALNVSLIRAHLRTCPQCLCLATRPERKIVSTLTENGPAMAGPAGPVPAPMYCASAPCLQC